MFCIEWRIRKGRMKDWDNLGLAVGLCKYICLPFIYLPVMENTCLTLFTLLYSHLSDFFPPSPSISTHPYTLQPPSKATKSREKSCS
jgi:hypothetical protein